MTLPEQSSIRHTESHRIDTFRDGNSSTAPAQGADTHRLTIRQIPRTEQPIPHPKPRNYVAPMTTAKAVLAAIDERKPNLPDTYKHNLLFFCQGHHLATHGVPMFAEAIDAVDTGAAVAIDTDVNSPISKRAHGMVGWVLHRYGATLPVDLQSLVCITSAWQLARTDTSETRIELAWLTDWFRRPAELAPEGRLAVAGIAAIVGGSPRV